MKWGEINSTYCKSVTTRGYRGCHYIIFTYCLLAKAKAKAKGKLNFSLSLSIYIYTYIMSNVLYPIWKYTHKGLLTPPHPMPGPSAEGLGERHGVG